MTFMLRSDCETRPGSAGFAGTDLDFTRWVETPVQARRAVHCRTGRPPRFTWRRCLVWSVALGAVVSFLLGLFVPSVVRQRQKGHCHDQLKRLGAALYRFQEINHHFPAAAITDNTGKPLLSWRVAILPQLGYQSLFDQFNVNEPWDSPQNLALAERMPSIYACPSLTGGTGWETGYQVVVGPKPGLGVLGTLFEWDRGVEIREVLDGTSNTVMIVETNRLIPWTKPDDLQFEQDSPLPQFGSRHEGGFHAVFADGSTRYLKHTMTPNILKAILTRDGGEAVGSS
jgi:hypothetical protein